MISIADQYFGIPKNIFFVIGLWPYQQMMIVQFQRVFVFGILITGTTIHLTPFLITECNTDIVLQVLSFTLIFSSYVINYSAFWFNMKSVKYTLEQLQRICDELKDKNELIIFEKYRNITRRYNVVFTIFAICGVTVFYSMQIWPTILDIVLPKNQSRPLFLFYPVEYFLEQYKYFYLVRLNINATNVLGIATVLGTTLIIFNSQRYFCGMFAIASYRIEHAMSIDMLKNINSNSERFISERIIKAVDIHRKAIKLSEFLTTRFDIMFDFLIMVGVTCLSLCLFRILLTGFNIRELYLPGIIVYIILLYMFVMNYIGQCITNHNRQIFTTVYNVQWYKAPLRVQKMILFLLQKGTKDYGMRLAGGLFTASLQCFLSLANASLSYFTLIYSVHVRDENV